MKIEIHYTALLRTLANLEMETLEFDATPTQHEALSKATQNKDDAFDRMLLAEDLPRPTIIVSLNEKQIRRPDNPELKDGDVIRLFSPIAGG